MGTKRFKPLLASTSLGRFAFPRNILNPRPLFRSGRDQWNGRACGDALSHGCWTVSPRQIRLWEYGKSGDSLSVIALLAIIFGALLTMAAAIRKTEVGHPNGYYQAY
ncbi:hypothetical protein L228DRAFT_266410 [Xylona heveae TC161]|uniref:Uncharacterized protein n=1 Tax=Xylona heveae (strain CBS 132557 / TC161) TaxID=1328760 RepID=A0A161TPE0_XYLHT|nr:hypothetical protein L228DRAFT_266410 [Xylona heveae TC161]KZF24046.1 hypothetical protein L228DRAFT_266410 [Xylona heveae TC161]